MNNRLTLVDIPVEEIESKALLPINTAKQLRITSDAELSQAGEIIRILKDLQDEVNRVFKPIVDQAFKAHKTAKAAQNEHLIPLEEAISIVRTKMNIYLREMEIERMTAAVERKAAEDNLRLQPAVEKSVENFPKFSASPVLPPKLPEVPPAPKAEGISTILEWKWKLLDASLIPAEFWILDEKAIDIVVRSMKNATTIPGIEVFSESRVTVRR